ncbi:MAG TPA: trehalose-phosphatase [Candidatus Polarisedimenticolaceae bacterium]
MRSAVRPEALATHVAAAARRRAAARVLLLDVDGTLAPIARRPEQVRIPGGILASLDRLGALGWRAALVSGRPAAEVLELFGGRPIAIFGSHGLEAPGVRLALEPAMSERLERLARRVEGLAEGWDGVFVERKPAGFAVHDRELDDSRLSAWRLQLRRTLARDDLSGLERIGGRRVTELRPAGAHKGRVAATWPPVREAAPEDPSVVAAGDDRTDEDLFRALGPGATTVQVGPPGIATAARWRLASPDAMHRFLHALARFSEGGVR